VFACERHCAVDATEPVADVRVDRDVRDADRERKRLALLTHRLAAAVPALECLKERGAKRFVEAEALREVNRHLAVRASSFDHLRQLAHRARHREHAADGSSPTAHQAQHFWQHLGRAAPVEPVGFDPDLHLVAEDVRRDMGLRRAARHREQRQVERVAHRSSVRLDVLGEPHREGRTPQCVVVRQSGAGGH
jgi:hypothetical protein